MTKPKLFLSFTRLVYAMDAGQVEGQDLLNGLFYFGCAREYLMQVPLELKIEINSHFNLHDKEERERATLIHNSIKDAVIVAEANGRAVFRPLYGEEKSSPGRNTISQLNRLLEANGIDTTFVKQFEGQEYKRDEVEESYNSLVDCL